MKTQDHTRILFAYLGRISLNDLIDIVEARKNSSYAAMNLGTSAQVDAHRELAEACERACDRLIEHDRQLIREITLKAAY